MAFHELELVAGSLSVLGALAVVWCYYKYDRAHPAQIILIIALLDCLLAAKFMLRATAWLIHPKQRVDHSESFHTFADGCATSIAWSAFFETATVAWNAIWCINLIRQLANPHRARSSVYYHAYGWLAPALMVGLQLGVSDYGQVSDGPYSFCSLRPSDHSNWVFLFEFGFVMINIAIALLSLVYAFMRLRQGGRESHRLLWHHATYAIVFAFLWGFERNLSWHKDLSKTGHQIMGLLWQCQGFFVALIRLNELRILSCCQRTQHTYVAITDTDDLVEERQNDPNNWGASSAVRSELEVDDAFGLKPGRVARENYVFSPQSPRAASTPVKVYGDL
eukprot:TRINITY_DN8585_c0_g1_i2.p1 TRINITY_DN8585_c0_g1~~TRINITY_DN8585_c0_g1_i2.p1  ORF type:complete len:345 (+),score=25.84 TRINITY_DN8585_c0_g1_i2:32-1036(+)